MSNNRRIISPLRLILALSFFHFVSGCAHIPKPETAEDLLHAYEQAVKDAEVVEQDEISKNLVAIIPENKALRWNEGTNAFRVVTWTAWDGYNQKVGETMLLSQPIWVTVVPQVKNFCQEHGVPASGVALRLEQLLGLPPESKKTTFAEMWVSPADLFRPSPDPEVSDHEAELDFPVSTRFVTVSDEHRRWFDDLKSKSYGVSGYPWTRLGYTYDWGNPKSEIGLSEFVIREGATVKIHSVSDTLDYCQ